MKQAGRAEILFTLMPCRMAPSTSCATACICSPHAVLLMKRIIPREEADLDHKGNRFIQA